MTAGTIAPMAVSDVPVGELRSPVDITLGELAIGAFFPADVATAEILRRLAEMPPDHPQRPDSVLACSCCG